MLSDISSSENSVERERTGSGSIAGQTRQGWSRVNELGWNVVSEIQTARLGSIRSRVVLISARCLRQVQLYFVDLGIFNG